MKRGAGADIFLRSIEKMRQTIPDLTLRTSFIVGFPGETEQDFEQLCQFVRDAQFDWLGVFGYSDEEGAKAFDLGEKVPAREIERRRKKLMSIQKQISRKKKRALIGRQFDVLLEGPVGRNRPALAGPHGMHAPEIDGIVYVNDFGDHENVREGEFYRCEITEAHEYDVRCEAVVAAGVQGGDARLPPSRQEKARRMRAPGN